MSESPGKYWICDVCATKQGLIPPDGGVTCIAGRCAWCGGPEEVTLTPVCDFEDPHTGRKPVWD